MVDSYRGIRFLTQWGKNNWLDCEYTNEVGEEYNIANKSQAGFRQGSSTTGNIFNLCNINNIVKSLNNRKLKCFFADFTEAFDVVGRNKLFYKLSRLGVSMKMIQFFINLYSDRSSCI